MQFEMYRQVGHGHKCDKDCCVNRVESVSVATRTHPRNKLALEEKAKARGLKISGYVEQVLVDHLNEVGHKFKRPQLEADIAEVSGD